MMALAYRGEGHILPSLNHSHIIQSFHSQGWGSPRVEIVMSLMEGTVASLNETYPPERRPELANSVLRQMLPALAYLAKLGYVHRDVKPDNIFYNTTGPDMHHFQLGDFGLCELESIIAADDGDAVGARSYQAPELHPDHLHKCCQTHKSDVWALSLHL
ncbi:kinase-like domain-containing protein [Chaetomium tenue]|uniref:Kinase-like domain-containing protein n=1 Tax=Chaetomium tenue TaxID=1854479 RepID=A0ACB7PGN8_9PEZI|nr:kinase-like domain-containing protein [Chaetomium globosum]